MKAGMIGRATAANLLRKCTSLNDIDVIIEDLQLKSQDLLSNAEKLAAKLAEEERIKNLNKNLYELSNNHMDFKSKDIPNRKYSAYRLLLKNQGGTLLL